MRSGYKVPKIQKGQKARYTREDLLARGHDLTNYEEKEGLFSKKDPKRSRSPSVMILPSEVSPGSSEEEVQVLKEVNPCPATPKDSSKKMKPMKEQILNLTNKEELAILHAAKLIKAKKKQIAEKNKALAATLAKSYERERKEKVLDTRQV